MCLFDDSQLRNFVRRGGVVRDERAFYKSYIQRTNRVNRELIQELNNLYMDKSNLSVMFGLA
jgi:hypothetical protein